MPESEARSTVLVIQTVARELISQCRSLIKQPHNSAPAARLRALPQGVTCACSSMVNGIFVIGCRHGPTNQTGQNLYAGHSGPVGGNEMCVWRAGRNCPGLPPHRDLSQTPSSSKVEPCALVLNVPFFSEAVYICI